MERDPNEAARAQAHDAARQAEEAARRTGDEARRQTRSFLDDQRSAAAARVTDLAHALRSSARELEGRQERAFSGAADRAADGLERLSHSLAENDVDGVIAGAEDFARRQPGAFLGGAVAAGFLLARFLRSSSAGHEHSAASADPSIRKE